MADRVDELAEEAGAWLMAIVALPLLLPLLIWLWWTVRKQHRAEALLSQEENANAA